VLTSVPGMTAIDASHVGGLLRWQVRQISVGFGGLELGRVQDIGRDGPNRVLASRTMAGFAGPGAQPYLLVMSTCS